MYVLKKQQWLNNVFFKETTMAEQCFTETTMAEQCILKKQNNGWTMYGL